MDYFFSTARNIGLLIALLVAPSLNGAETPNIRVGMDLWPGYYPLVIAKQREGFNRRQLNVRYHIPENTDKMLSAFKQGELDIICVALGDVFALLKDQPDLRVILVADISAGGDALLSLSKMPDNLQGLKIGTNTGGFGELFVQQFLKEYHTPFDQVELINIEASAASQHLYAHELDIVHTWEPYLSSLHNQGAKILYTSRQTPGLIPDVIVAHPSLMRLNPNAVTLFVDAWLEAVEWWQHHPAEGNTLLQQSLQLKDPVSLKGIKLMNREDNLDAFHNKRSPRALKKVIPRYTQFFNSKGLNINAKQIDIVDGRFLNKRSPQE